MAGQAAGAAGAGAAGKSVECLAWHVDLPRENLTVHCNLL